MRACAYIQRLVQQLAVGVMVCYCTCIPIISSAAGEDQSFARVIICQNDVGRAEIYLPGSAMTKNGKPELRLSDKTIGGYLAFDFTPVGKNKTLNAVSIRMGDNGKALMIELRESGLSATIPLAGGNVAFPQRLAEEMSCKPLNKN